MIKLSNRQKLAKSLKFIHQLKINPKVLPFLQPQQMQRLGLYDFRFVNKRFIKLANIQQRLKDNKYDEFDDLINDLKLVFQMIGYYVPLTDPLQVDVKHFLNQVQKWKSICQGTAIQQIPVITRSSAINTTKQKSNIQQVNPKQYGKQRNHYQNQRQKNIKNYAKIQQQKQKANQFTKAYRLPIRSTLSQKLEMIYFLKSHQLNQPFIHMIGDMYGIGKETDDQYVIKLDNSTSCAWLHVLQGLEENAMAPE